LRGRFHYHGELTREGKIKFLESLDLFSTPTVYRESKGLPILEAWANGVPAVMPDHGAFPELAAAAGGALLHRPLDAYDLACKLAELLADPARGEAMGSAAQSYVRSRHGARRMAEDTLTLYQRLAVGEGSAAPAGQRPRSDAILQA
jgi:glycosyltransferase involved in cell wall biosynthesis